MLKELNNQINAEFWSAYLYLSMTAYFEENNLSGFAKWMNIQYQEETTHANRLFKYVYERGGSVKLQPIDAVKTTWKDEIEIFQETLDHERKVTALINNLVDIAIEEKDHATNNMLQWFISEQVEEEASVEEILNQLKMLEGNKHGLLMLYRELKQRIFVDETEKD